MRREDACAYLIRSVIPEVADQGSIPDDPDLACFFPAAGVGPDGTQTRRSNLVWDVVWRAHRDVARHYFDKDVALYCGVGRDGAVAGRGRRPAAAPYGIARELFARIVGSARPLSSQDLLSGLCDAFPEPEPEAGGATRFGAVQLLVNATLRDLLVLKALGCAGLDGIEIDEAGCDCPLDAVTLEAMGGDRGDWMRLTPDEYARTQRALRKSLFLDSGVAYDFLVRSSGKLFAED